MRDYTALLTSIASENKEHKSIIDIMWVKIHDATCENAEIAQKKTSLIIDYLKLAANKFRNLYFICLQMEQYELDPLVIREEFGSEWQLDMQEQKPKAKAFLIYRAEFKLQGRYQDDEGEGQLIQLPKQLIYIVHVNTDYNILNSPIIKSFFDAQHPITRIKSKKAMINPTLSIIIGDGISPQLPLNNSESANKKKDEAVAFCFFHYTNRAAVCWEQAEFYDFDLMYQEHRHNAVDQKKFSKLIPISFAVTPTPQDPEPKKRAQTFLIQCSYKYFEYEKRLQRQFNNKLIRVYEALNEYDDVMVVVSLDKDNFEALQKKYAETAVKFYVYDTDQQEKVYLIYSSYINFNVMQNYIDDRQKFLNYKSNLHTYLKQTISRLSNLKISNQENAKNKENKLKIFEELKTSLEQSQSLENVKALIPRIQSTADQHWRTAGFGSLFNNVRETTSHAELKKFLPREDDHLILNKSRRCCC